MESLGGLKVRTDIQRIFLALLLQQLFALGQRRTQEGISVGSEHNLLWLEIERDNFYMLAGNMKPVDDAVCDVLFLHGLDHVWYDERTGSVVAQQFFLADALG